ncbi:MAG: S-layer family protein [Calothrix sp. SM1_7_51]|nr:S-layer family protein [Calothrix sp. SM1_7_51]
MLLQVPVGKVNINAIGLFGIAPLSLEQLEKLRPDDLNPRNLVTNDITAISQTNPSLSGEVTINSPEVDPSRALIQLPINLVDASQQIAQGCAPSRLSQQSSFIATGRGGLPFDPTELLEDNNTIEQWVRSPTVTSRRIGNAIFIHENYPQQIVEAQGMIVDGNGTVKLIAQIPDESSTNFRQSPNFCHLNLK